MVSSLFTELAWFKHSEFQALLSLLNMGDGKTMLVGGAVRNVILGERVKDLDLATNLPPEVVLTILRKASLKVVETGLSHGTVSAILSKDFEATGVSRAIEITTLRSDIETDGRHAKVQFINDWTLDAKRRDFTMNALYLGQNAEFMDPLSGLDDCKAGVIKFIGDAEDRIEEDYLRILRFFRFFAQFGSGRPETEGLKACARLRDGLANVSVERVWEELLKILSTPNPSRAILWMRTTGVFDYLLPENGKFGVDILPRMSEFEDEYQWGCDPILRLAGILPPRLETVEALSARLKISKIVKSRLSNWACAPIIPEDCFGMELEKFIHQSGCDVQGFVDQLKLAVVTKRAYDEVQNVDIIKTRMQQLSQVKAFEKRDFPLTGADLMDLGYSSGVALGNALKALETQWVEEDFSLSKEELAKRAKAALPKS